MKGKQKVPILILHRNLHTYNAASADLRKKAVKKFEWWALINEIDVTNVW